MSSSLEIKVDSSDLRKLYQDLKVAGDGLQIDLRRQIKKAGDGLVSAVKKEASWSSRIPGAVKVKTSFGAKNAGVTVYVDAGKAPEAAPLNNQGNSGTFRHPVFPDAAGQIRQQWTWVSQRAQPFFDGPIAREGNNTLALIQEVIDDFAARAGFR